MHTIAFFCMKWNWIYTLSPNAKFSRHMRVWGYCLSCNDIWGYHHKVRWERTGRSAHVQDISHVSQTDPLINRPGSWDEASQRNVSSPTVFFSTYANTYYWLYFCLLPTQFWVKNVVLDVHRFSNELLDVCSKGCATMTSVGIWLGNCDQ